MFFVCLFVCLFTKNSSITIKFLYNCYSNKKKTCFNFSIYLYGKSTHLCILIYVLLLYVNIKSIYNLESINKLLIHVNMK